MNENESQDRQDYKISGKGAFMGVHDAHYEAAMPYTHKTVVNMLHGFYHLAHSAKKIFYIPKMTKAEFLNNNKPFLAAFQRAFKKKHDYLIQVTAIEDAAKMFIERMEDIYKHY